MGRIIALAALCGALYCSCQGHEEMKSWRWTDYYFTCWIAMLIHSKKERD